MLNHTLLCSSDTGSPPEGRSDSKEEPYESVKFSAELQKIALMLYKTGEVLVCQFVYVPLIQIV